MKLSNCEFERVGDKHDGGYVVCKNLVERADAFYSYGISASDNWGCTLSARHKRPVHQYDCFNVERPPCEGALPVFHEECVGPQRETVEGRLFDTVAAQIERNGDAGKRLVMKPPFHATTFELLLVNKKIGVLEPGATPVIPNPFDSPNNWMRPDCQGNAPRA